MTEKDKDFKIVFAPGCFDSFDGSQEELDELLAQIHGMFEGKSREEIEAMSEHLTEEEFEELPEDVQEQILGAVNDEDSEVPQTKRKLQ
jgi:hypothetical protein